MTSEIRKWYAKLTQDEQLLFDERVAIMEYHGELDRTKAEEVAYYLHLHCMIHQGINAMSLKKRLTTGG